jgi:hypothetical protein
MKQVAVEGQDHKIQSMEQMVRNHSFFNLKRVVKHFLIINSKYSFKCRNTPILKIDYLLSKYNN